DWLKRVCEDYINHRKLPGELEQQALCFSWLQFYKNANRRPGRRPGKPFAAAEAVEILQEQKVAKNLDPAKWLIKDRKYAAKMYGITYNAVAEAHGRLLRNKAKS